MKYRFAAGESVAKGVRRIARAQIDMLIANLSPPFKDHAVAVHEARKSLKKLRALLRLVRDEIGDERYRRDNAFLRDAARRLSAVRDAAVLGESLKGLRKEKGDRELEDAFSRALRALENARKDQGDEKETLRKTEEAMREVARDLERMRKKLERLPIDRNDFRALKRGLRNVYRRGRRGFAEALAEPGTTNLHDWRKQVKYLWYHMRLLKPVWPDVTGALAGELRELGEDLGADHDLAVLDGALRAAMSDDEDALEKVIGVIGERRRELQERAFSRGARIFSEKPKPFVNRLEGYWKIWRDEPEPDDGTESGSAPS